MLQEKVTVSREGDTGHYSAPALDQKSRLQALMLLRWETDTVSLLCLGVPGA